ncbi:hypothetical protein ABTF26_19910, partial [Acinetobacter baumannii]
QPMLLRDESRINYKGYENRDSGKLYIGEPDLDEIERIAAELWSAQTALAARAVTSWFRPRSGGESYLSRQSSRSYCRHHEVSGAEQLGS